MKIAMFGHKHVPSREGGVEVVVGELSARMAQMGHRIICYNRAGHHIGGTNFDTEKSDTIPGVRCKPVITINKKGIAAVTSSISAAICSAFSDARVVHIHAEGPALMCWLPKLFGKRVIVTVHGLDWQREKWQGGFGAKYIHMGEKAAVRFADEIIVLSRSVQKYFEDTYGRKTRWIPNGVTEPEACPPAQITGLGLEKDSYILYLGRLVPEKGVHYLIEAYKRSGCDKKLVIAGSVSDTNAYARRLQEMAAGDERILFTGFVQGQLLQELYSNAYVYCLPSDLEGMPLSLLEAMSYGNCCLVSDIPEITEVTGDHAFCFPKGDVAALAAGLRKLCDDPVLVSRYRAAAKEYILSGHDWDKITAETLEVYLAKEKSLL